MIGLIILSKLVINIEKYCFNIIFEIMSYLIVSICIMYFYVLIVVLLFYYLNINF